MRARLRIDLATPAASSARTGNRVTALRWAKLLRQLGHRVRLAGGDGDCDLLVALHARRSHPQVARFRGPVVVAMTGTDLYEDLPRGDPDARRSLELAWRVVVLQEQALAALPPEVRPRARTIVQSARPPRDAPPPSTDRFEVCVLGHLRAVKDPLRAALAARLLPPSSRVAVVGVGAALDPAFAAAARAEERENPRYRWLGELPRDAALRRLASSSLLALTSVAEGGANVIAEAIVCGVPVVATRIPGALGLLGEDYPAVYDVGDTAGLAALLARIESDAAFRESLRARGERLRPRFAPETEREAWRALLAELP